MKPTPAQIEAAKNLVHRFEYESMALHHIQREWLQREIAALTAAAEVEGQAMPQLIAMAEKNRDNATIERCAQVAEYYAAQDCDEPLGHAIAAAIRKLKDEHNGNQ